ncbi:MFS transporter [Angelakisella massiliensis]|uniref:MFS transporter n=1 Tax=Angelakisella massiliensis TaxID=1871018 RepID=UPI0023A8A85E|nr:MFS transporter [Angelakisella massiliensis]
MSKSPMTRAEKSWVLYDVACSAFTMLISTTIPILFRSYAEADGVSPEYASALWGWATSAAVLVMGLFSCILGALADYRGMKKRLFGLFLVLSLGGVAVLSTVSGWQAFLVAFVVVRIGYSACNVFYDSMLVDVTTDQRMDMLSSQGYAWGYLGSCIPFVAGLALIFTTPFGLNTQQATQLSFLLTGVWWLALTIPLLRNVRQTHYLENRQGKLNHAFRRLAQTFRKVRQDKKMLLFILGYFCYIDGVYTIISMATVYGGELGLSSSSMVLALLLTQLVAFPFAILSGKLSQKIGDLPMIKSFILIYIGICLFGFQLDQEWEFWALAVAVGMCQGGIQAISRSHFGKMVPKEQSNEYFGLFDIFGKFADFFGPMIMSASAVLLGSSTYGILALAALFVLGYLLVTFSQRAEAGER